MKCQAHNSKTKRKVIIDTDAALDDAEAIVYLSACDDIEIVAITLVAGNASMDVITPNALRTLSYLNHNVPVYISGSYNLSGFADIELPESKFLYNTDMNSSQALIHYARKYPGEITFLFIGPLTNLATAFIQDNSIPSMMDSIIIMGSDRSEEVFNAIRDPVAYSIIAKCFKNIPQTIQILDWTTCRTHLFPIDTIEKIHNFSNSNENVILHNKLFCIFTDRTNSQVAKYFWGSEFLSCDLMAALSVNHPEIFTEKKKVNISHVDINGLKYGHTEYKDDENGYIELAIKIDIDLASKILINALCRTKNN